MSRKGSREDKKKPGDDLLSHGLNRSTIGAGGLNFRVRNGNGWDPSAVVTRQFDTFSHRLRFSPVQNRKAILQAEYSRPSTLGTSTLGTSTLVRAHRQFE